MSKYVTEEQLDNKLRTHTDEIVGIVKDFMGQVSEQFNNVDDQFKAIHDRLDSIDQKYDRLLNTIDGFISRIDKYETEQAARDQQFEKLLSWARKVSEKTGVPLENL